MRRELCGTESHSALWAGMGRAVNNAGAAVVTGGSIALVEGGNVILISSVVLGAFCAYQHCDVCDGEAAGKEKDRRCTGT